MFTTCAGLSCLYIWITSRDRHLIFFFFNDTATTEIYTLSLHDALPISMAKRHAQGSRSARENIADLCDERSEEHTSELQSRPHLVCRLLLEKKKKKTEKLYDEDNKWTAVTAASRREHTRIDNQ